MVLPILEGTSEVCVSSSSSVLGSVIYSRQSTGEPREKLLTERGVGLLREKISTCPWELASPLATCAVEDTTKRKQTWEGGHPVPELTDIALWEAAGKNDVEAQPWDKWFIQSFDVEYLMFVSRAAFQETFNPASLFLLNVDQTILTVIY